MRIAEMYRNNVCKRLHTRYIIKICLFYLGAGKMAQLIKQTFTTKPGNLNFISKT